nr:ClbS/DfsB family four-helix bundle protein [Bacillus sp. TE8-1]
MTPDYKWNNLGGLYQSFYEQYGRLTLKQQEEELTKLVQMLVDWINDLSEVELFQPEQRKWVTTKAKWPIWKWVHINTVAPFTNFRTKIRKWKKTVL